MTPRRAFRFAARLCVLALVGGAPACAVFNPPVARTVGGVTSEGRFIEPDAYALYAMAALYEARGAWEQALQLYQRAYDVDPRGPELKTRIGAVACKLRRFPLAEESLAAALARDESYGPAWFELSQCQRTRGDLTLALAAAGQALRLDPERPETSLLAADLAEQRGDVSGAWRVRDALATHARGSAIVQRAILAAAERAGDAQRSARARRALAELGRSESDSPEASGIPRAVAALHRGDLPTARAEAERLLGADPGNGDALLIALCAADLAQDHEAFARLLQATRARAAPVSAELLVLLEALLGRRLGSSVARLVHTEP